jgi:hypothetical protein
MRLLFSQAEPDILCSGWQYWSIVLVNVVSLSNEYDIGVGVDLLMFGGGYYD